MADFTQQSESKSKRLYNSSHQKCSYNSVLRSFFFSKYISLQQNFLYSCQVSDNSGKFNTYENHLCSFYPTTIILGVCGSKFGTKNSSILSSIHQSLFRNTAMTSHLLPIPTPQEELGITLQGSHRIQQKTSIVAFIGSTIAVYIRDTFEDSIFIMVAQPPSRPAPSKCQQKFLSKFYKNKIVSGGTVGSSETHSVVSAQDVNLWLI